MSDATSDPWFSLWSALAHQGDVYSASFAAVPHTLAAVSGLQVTRQGAALHFCAWVEICRCKNAVPVPPDVQSGYFSALASLPTLLVGGPDEAWDISFTSVAMACLAAARGQPLLAEVALELSSIEDASEILSLSMER
jgi:hypothetical protein